MKIGLIRAQKRNDRPGSSGRSGARVVGNLEDVRFGAASRLGSLRVRGVNISEG